MRYRAVESPDSAQCYRIEKEVTHRTFYGKVISGWQHVSSECVGSAVSKEVQEQRVREVLRRYTCPKVVTLEDECG